jgi:glycosyltransferase involved in cell wall biosynthesis
MKVLLCHNHYQEPGGEDQVFDTEGWLLESHGHRVVRFTLNNDAIPSMSRLALASKTFWNGDAYDELRRLIRREQPDVMHCTNIFPLISPAAYSAARDEHLPVVQSLHNYRLICPKAQFVRNGKVCELCLGKRFSWPAIVHSCYRDSKSATTVVAGMLAYHWAAGTWSRLVDRYIALTEFSRRKFIEGGLPAAKIDVKPNCVRYDLGLGAGEGGYAVFVGRLSREKGIATLLQGWQRLDSAVPLKIVGDGSMADQVRSAADNNPAITWLGRKPHHEVAEIIGNAHCLVFSSDWYETFGLVTVEAFAKGIPVIASNLGAMSELIDHGRTGLHFEPANPDDLAAKVRQLWADPQGRLQMRQEARAEFEAKYTHDRNYEMLMSVYNKVLASRFQGSRI